MNPHDPAERPGAHLVAAELDAADPWELSDRHPLRDPLNIVGGLVATAAHEVDDLHSDLTLAATYAIQTLQPLSRGNVPTTHGSYELLGPAGLQLELLAARLDTAYEHLTRAVSAYRRLLPDPALETASAELDPTLKRTAGPASGRDDDWAISGDRQTKALQAVERGGLRLKQSAMSEQDRYLSDGTGVLVPVWTQTIERMLADGLLDIDTSTTPTQGQLLALTPLGREALRTSGEATAATLTGPVPAPHDVDDPVQGANSPGPAPVPRLSPSASGEAALPTGRAQDPRTTAALSRSTRSPAPAKVPAVGPSATGQTKPPRTR